ncbi:DUF3558 domain-containing protein [Nocardia nova]|uniref:DUF3558 domain-containing protein n=1 Tax=Nocardia nova TaxID=37330 RepID=UPI0033E1AFB1
MAVAIGAAVAAAGCSTDTNGTPTATADPAAALWDPCTSIPDEALRASNVDPANKQSGISGVEQSGWKICKWRGPQYAISIYSTAKGTDEVVHKAGNVDIADVTVAGRAGQQYRAEGASKNLDCDVAFPVAQGTVELEVLGRASLDNPPDPCKVIADIGPNIVPSFPK